LDLPSCVNYVAPPDDVGILKTAHTIYRNMEQYPQALQISIRLNDHDMMREDFEACADPILKRQLAFLLARQQILLEVDDEVLQGIVNNTRLSEYFTSLARDLDIMEPKVPEDIYKSHLENVRSGMGGGSVDSARQNLASTFVNAFVNVGFGSDKLLTGTEGGNSWMYKNKDHGHCRVLTDLVGDKI
jgi:26S proteasome regulatory subunit N1